MADKEKPPDPIEDVRKGLGLLFRAAKTAVQKIPTDPIEKVVLDGAREVGRAVENVATTIDKKIFHPEKPGAKADDPAAPAAEAKPDDAAKKEEPPPPDAPTNGPRVG
jgi:hypothetical protein